MFLKLLTAIVFATAVAAALLMFRQHRLELMHEMAQLHARIDHTRQQTWDLQVRIAEKTQPESLREALQRTELKIEPVVPAPPTPGGYQRRVAEVQREHE